MSLCKSRQLDSRLKSWGPTKDLEDVGRGNGVDSTRMECELEEEAIFNEEGKKHQRFEVLISNVSNVQD